MILRKEFKSLLLLVIVSIFGLSGCTNNNDGSYHSSPVCGEYSFAYPTYFQEGFFAGRNRQNGENSNGLFFLTVKSISEKEYHEANGENVLFDYATCKYFLLGLSLTSLQGEGLTIISLMNMHLYIDATETFYYYADETNKIIIFSKIEINSTDSIRSASSYFLEISFDDKTDSTSNLYRVST